MSQSKSVPSEHEDLSLIPNTHVKNVAPVRACHPNTGEAEVKEIRLVFQSS